MKQLLIFASLLLVGCSLQLQDPQVEVPKSYIFAGDYNIDNTPIGECWWQSFGDTLLNSRVRKALSQNRDLLASMEAVESSRQYLQAVRAEYLPTLSFETEAEFTHEEQTTTKEYTLAPTLEWELSLFGARRNTRLAALTALLEQEWAMRGVWLTLTAQVASTHFQLMQYERSLLIASRSFKLRQKATALIDSMYRHGMSSGIDLMQAKSLVYSAKSEMEQYERLVATTSLALGVLLGETPQRVDWSQDGRGIIDDSLPCDLPIAFPSTLLERRPDVMKCYYAMAEAAAQVGVSRAERYPTITLSGSGGVFASSLEGLTSGDPLLWSATAELTAPLFSWGALRRKELMARAKYRATIADYEQSVLEALSEVEQRLITIDTTRDEMAAITALVIANSQIAKSTSALYRSGLGDYLSVIDAERELYSSQISLVELIAESYVNYVELFKSLGGGV